MTPLNAPPPTLRARRKEELRERILDCARALFVEHGFEAFSMRKLAEEVGCSVGNLYLYFSSQEELFRCIVDDSFAELHATVTVDVAGSSDPVAALKRGIRGYVDFGLSNPDAYRMAFLVRRPVEERATIRPHAPFEVLRRGVAACIKARRFRAVDVELASQALWSAMHGVTSLLIQLPHFPWVERERLIKTVIDNAVDGFTRSGKGKK